MAIFAIFEVPRASGWGKIGPRRPLGRSSEPLELLETSWSALGGLLEASWSTLGALQGRNNKVGNGSWPLHKAFGDWFQLSWGPTNRQGESKYAPKWDPWGLKNQRILQDIR